MSYYYTWRGAPMGPISQEELIDLAETEALPRETSVWQEGQTAWVRLRNAMETLGHPLPPLPDLPDPQPPEGLAIHDFEAFPPRQPPPRITPWPPPNHAPPPGEPTTWRGAPEAPAPGAPPAAAAAPTKARRARIPVPAKSQPPAASPEPPRPEPGSAPATPPPLDVRGTVSKGLSSLIPKITPRPVTAKKTSPINAPKPIVPARPRKTATLRPPRARSLSHPLEEVEISEVEESNLTPWVRDGADDVGYTSDLTDSYEEANNTFAGPALNFGDIEPIIDWQSPSGLRLAAPPPIARSRFDSQFEALDPRLPEGETEEAPQEMAVCAISGEEWPRSLMVKYKGKLVAPQHLKRLQDGEITYIDHGTSPLRQWLRLILVGMVIAVGVWILWPHIHPDKEDKESGGGTRADIAYNTAGLPLSQDHRTRAASALPGETWARLPVDQWPSIVMTQEAVFKGNRKVTRGCLFLVNGLSGQVAGITALTLLQPANGVNPAVTLDTLNEQFLTWRAWPRGQDDTDLSFTGRYGGLPVRQIYYPDVVLLTPEVLELTESLPVQPLTMYPAATALGARAWLLCIPENMPNVRQMGLGGVIIEHFEDTETRFTIMLDQPAFAAGMAGSPVVNPQGYLIGVITAPKDRPDNLGRARQFQGEPNAAYYRILERQYDRPQ